MPVISVWATLALVAAGYKRGTVRKTRSVLAQTLDHHQVDPNPVRDPRVRLPREHKPHVPPPLAEHVERASRNGCPPT
jgi:hypothetical protein